MKKFSVFLLATFVALINPMQALALSNNVTCTSPTFNSYSCVADYGYTGTDPYHVDRFAVPGVDGHKHSCTSFAAYTLALFNPPMPKISGFDAARSWAVDAITVGATISHTPHPGDIAQWGKPTDISEGHVAYVEQIKLSNSGAIVSIILAEDNSTLRVTRKKELYVSDQSTSGNYLSWPDNFITFPSYSGGGGGKPPVALVSPLGGNN